MAAPVAVAVVSWNTRDLLRRCLDALEPEERAGRAEVWVVDNGSIDASAEMVRAEFGWARLVEREDNPGFGRAVNLVAERTSTSWIAAANADVTLRPGALRALLGAGERDPSVGILAPRLVLPDGSTQHSVFAFPTLARTLLANLGGHRVLPGLGARLWLEGYWDSSRAHDVPWAIGAFLLVRRAAWDAVGGFDPGQWMYAEDLDLGWRVARAGWRTRYVPESVAEHAGSAAASQAFGTERTARWLSATYAWLRRRRGLRYARLVAAVNTSGAAARVVLLTGLVAVRPERYGWKRDIARGWGRAHRAGLEELRQGSDRS